jgi:septal ring factor EnvC (AmiA/AmiB activator)
LTLNRTSRKGKGSAQIILQRSITELSKKIRQTAFDIDECDRDIISLKESAKRIQTQILESKAACQTLDEREKVLLHDLEDASQKRHLVAAFSFLIPVDSKGHSSFSKITEKVSGIS